MTTEYRWQNKEEVKIMSNITVIDGGVNAAKGFLAAGVAAGVKYSGRKDMAMIYSKEPCVVAGTFTTNVVKAAPVLWDMDVVNSGNKVNAVVVNSGIANAATGKAGLDICDKTATKAAQVLGINKENVLIGSTGVIGMQVPIDRISLGIDALAKILKDDVQSAHDAEAAIMTTDTVPKEIAVKVTIGGTEVTIGGMSKGSGMIHPNMCTMLAYICTDCAISKEMLTKIVKEDINDTFNMITVDGDTSTNDTYLVLANGLAGNKVIDSEGEDFETFKAALHYIDEYLAKNMAKDGEGATALFETKVFNAPSKNEARILAKSVVGSSLCKAAIFGHDANFGRILCALGYSGVDFNPDLVELHYESAAGKVLLFKDGAPVSFDEEYATKVLSEKEVTVLVDMHQGDAAATAWGCDLSYDYVKINADYRS